MQVACLDIREQFPSIYDKAEEGTLQKLNFVSQIDFCIRKVAEQL
jgi:hypothetical protein